MRSASGPEFSRRGDDPATAPERAAMELLGQRWMMRVIWELEPGALGFLELRRRMGNCSSSMLSDRLHRLAATGLVARDTAGDWELTLTGAQLGAALTSLWEWADTWARDEIQPSQLGAPRLK